MLRFLNTRFVTVAGRRYRCVIQQTKGY